MSETGIPGAGFSTKARRHTFFPEDGVLNARGEDAAEAPAILRASTTRALTAGARINFPAVRPESHLIPGYLLASTQIETSGANPFFPARASLDERRALSPDA
jgi:hypothetical protein